MNALSSSPTKKIEANGREWHYRWNGHGMLSEVERPDGHCVRFEYDALARRTKKATVSIHENGNETVVGETRFVWDGNAVLHEIDAERGPTTWYWEPGTFAPVLKEQSGRTWSIATDHIGTPPEMYDELGELAWRMQLDVFGVPTVETGDEEACPWRWPGQYADRETGDYYNRWRYYDPARGGYHAQDPIALDGGLRLYGYPLDPVGSFDPRGLDTSSDAAALRAAMVDAGVDVPGFAHDAHHIVLSNSTAPAWDAVRRHLDDLGVGINSHHNGVFLPHNTAVATAAGSSAIPHTRIHTHAYRDYVKSRIMSATTKRQAIARLRAINQQILAGTPIHKKCP